MITEAASAIATGVLAGALSFATLAFAFIPLERAFPARRSQPVRRRELLIDTAFFFGQYALWNAVAFAVLSFVEHHAHAHLASSFHAFVGKLPVWLQALLAVVLGDVLVYWWHRACHAWEPLWRFHAVHHTSEHLDWVAAHREHPVDGVTTALAANLPAFAMCFRMDTVAMVIAFRAMWAIFIHSNVRLPLGPLRFLLGAPELHHWHHAKRERTEHNFANLAPWLDVLFGTYHRPDPSEEEGYALGTTEPMPRGYLAQLAEPFRKLARRSRPASGGDCAAPVTTVSPAAQRGAHGISLEGS